MVQESRTDIPKAYNPQDVEGRIYAFWENGGYFAPAIVPGKQPFVIMMPPPNVTGELHLGHGLTAAVEDVLARWHRMLGEPTLWLPGKDHAGIATQWVVEQQLAREGTSRHSLGRHAFEQRVWQWVEKYGDAIDGQHKRLGTSCDWSRQRFTLDPGPARAVRTTFVNLYNKGLIYRGERIINWCPRCTTALSDLEVEHRELDGRLYYIRYPLQPPEDTYITVATTRPETMLGDTAVAVHPDDSRYRRMVGHSAVLPIIGRLLPIVADPAIQPEFGTGALKVTPSHDPMDFEIGQRHDLPSVTVIGPDGCMTAEAGHYQGQDRMQAREGIVAQLEREGLLEKTEPYRHSVGHCQRCATVVEPLVSTQWFLNVGRHDDPHSIAGKAYSAVSEGRIKIVPERFSRVYLNWLENIRDWCISRQLWWGHRIPVWYCQECAGQTSAVEDPAQCVHCRSGNLQQDPDVLDTWFSSALWTHSTLGWPDSTPDMDHFYPTSVMETGYDILFFWVARMIMMGIENTGREPFHTVFLHGLIRDAEGAKMSKTRGNALDPLVLIDRYGTDALRFALTTGTAPGNDLRLSEAKLEASRNFANKLWNASSFVIASLDGATGVEGWHDLSTLAHREDRWIMSRLYRVIGAVGGYLERFELGEAQRELYDFVWHEYCDWYIEMAKIRLRGGDEPSPLPVLAHVLECTLRLLHPFMPFISEEVWQNLKVRLPQEGSLPESIMVAPYPEPQEWRMDSEAEAHINLVRDVVTQIRQFRTEQKLDVARLVGAVVDVREQTAGIDAEAAKAAVESETAAIQRLARVASLSVLGPRDDDHSDMSEGTAFSRTAGGERPGDPLAQVWISLVDMSAVAPDRGKFRREIQELEQAIARLASQLENEEFRAKAPAEIRQRLENQRLAHLVKKRQLEESLARLG